MALIAKETEVVSASPKTQAPAVAASAPRAEDGGARVQPVALEVPVTVNGAHSVNSSDKREPFSESTKTVLVFGHGAVIRLSAAVAPGQLLFLTNEKTKREVVCQVVKSKNYRNVSGYVELEFTEPAVGFWGMRFPNDRAASQPVAPASAPSAPDARVADSKLPSAPQVPAAQIPAARPAAPPANNAISSSIPAKPVAPAPAAAAQEPIPQRRASDSRPPAPPAPAQSAPASDAGTGALKQEAARLQQQLSSMVFSDAPAAGPASAAPSGASASSKIAEEAAAKIIEFSRPVSTPVVPASDAPNAKAVTAPPAKKPAAPVAKSALDLAAEEVKIPSWLEPLARHAAAPPVTTTHAEPAKPAAAANHAAAVSEEAAAEAKAQEAHSANDAAAESASEAAAPVESDYVPAFGTGLLSGDEDSDSADGSGSSKKGLVIGLVAAGLIATAAGWWYTHGGAFVPSAPAVAASAPAANSANAAVNPPASPVVNVNAPVDPGAQPAAESSSAISAPGTAWAVSSAAVNPAPESALAAAKSRDAAKALPGKASAPEAEDAVAAEPKRLSVGKVRLYKPTVAKNESSNPDSVAAPALSLSAVPAAGEAVNPGAFVADEKQPAAPLPVGGEVQAARLLSSVQPAYPVLARTQHVSGDVKLDALVDASGRVSAMKVISGPVLLQQAAMDALRQWKYQPATLDGKPVPMHLSVTIRFRM